MKNLITLFLLFTTLQGVHAQSSKDAKNMDLQQLKAMMEQIQSEKQNSKSKSKNNTTNTQTEKKTAPTPDKYNRNSTSAKYSRSTIVNAYKYLSDAEKDKVKAWPEVPEALRNNVDAQDFLDKLNGIDVYAFLQQNVKGSSMAFTGYLLSYQNVVTKAQNMVREHKKLEAEFLKHNGNLSYGKNVGKTYISENELVYLPLGDASFADKLIDANYITGNIKFPSENCLGIPDYVESKKVADYKGVYSLGLNGTLTIQFTNNALVDGNGPDLFVFEAGAIEPTNLEISKNGKDWIAVGKIEGGTAAVDIKDFAKPNEYYYYVRLTDLTTTSAIAGADIDAIAAIGSAMRMNLNAEVLFDVGKAELKQEGIAAIKKLAIQLQNISNANVVIIGHTDDVGDAAANDALSLARAKSVSAVLQSNFTKQNNFQYQEVGKGESEPAVPNTTEANKKLNRRVEILVNKN